MAYENIANLAFEELRQRSQKRIYQRDPEAWLHDVLGKRWWSKQREIALSVTDPTKAHTYTLVKSCNGVGKDLPLDTPLPTPTGWTTMGEVRPGDLLLDESGNPTRVMAKSAIFHNRLYKITFSDGAEVVSSETHLWNTIDFRAARAARARVAGVSDWRDHWDISETRETREMIGDLKRWNGSLYSQNHSIPINRALNLPDADLLIDPYILGAWLGDGTSDAPSMSIGEDGLYMIDEFAKKGVVLGKVRSQKYGYQFARQGYRDLLRELGVFKNKHIPAQYLRASESQRRELLRGLMDTDGFHGHHQTCGIDLMNKELSYDVVELIRSLGVRASIKPGRTYLNGRDVGLRYRIVFNPTFDPFTKGQYKSDRWSAPQKSNASRTARTIVSIEEVPTVPSQCVMVDSPRNLYLATEYMIPTHNSHIGGDLATWQVAVHDPFETTVLLSAPVFKQIKTVTFRYIADNYSLATARKFILPGEMVAEPGLKVQRLDGGLAKDVIQAKRPSDNNLVASFQGIHDGYVMVILDEAGGLPEDMWTAANAVTTNENVRILAIGNPDALNTGFHRRFMDPDKFREWTPITISAESSPNFTGEMIYPDDLDRDKQVKSLLVQRDWADMMRRQAHPNVVLAKVDGEFPKDGDNSFFPQSAINKAYDTEIMPSETDVRRMGVDLAFSGSDKSTVYMNIGGNIRKVDEWVHEDDFMKVARMVHNLALRNAADELRVDAAGTGRGIFSLLDNEHEFTGKPYQLIGFRGGTGSPDTSQWAQARAWHYDSFRSAMQQGLIDLDDEDKELRDELFRQTYSMNGRGAIQITPKDAMRKAGIASPDHLDAVIYSAVDISWLTDGLQPGDKVAVPIDNIAVQWEDVAGMPW